MKPILIDDLIDLDENQSDFTVNVGEGDQEDIRTGWQIAKPLNYDPDYLSQKDREEMAQAVLDGKAIAVCFFEDYTPEEQSEYVKKKIKK